MMKRSNVKKIWIRQNGKKIEYSRDEVPECILYPYSNKIPSTVNRELLVPLRPMITLKKQLGRYAKDRTYLLIKEHLDQFSIVGPYAGLAANYPGEIFTALYPHIHGTMDIFEMNKKSAGSLLLYMYFMKEAYSYKEFFVNFNVIPENILKWFQTKNTRKYSIIDMDLMTSLSKEGLNEVIKGLQNKVGNQCTIALWQTVGRKGATCDQFDNELRPYLLDKMNKTFAIKRYDTHDYWEGFPIRCDIFTVEK